MSKSSKTMHTYPGPGVSGHLAFNTVYPSLPYNEAARFSSLVTKLRLTADEYEEAMHLYAKSGQYQETIDNWFAANPPLIRAEPLGELVHRANRDTLHLADLQPGRSRINAMTSAEMVMPETAASHAPGIALGVAGLAVLGLAGYYAFKKSTPPAAPVVPAPAPAPSSYHGPAPAAPPPPPPQRTSSASQTFATGQHVSAQWTDGNWYPGRIAGHNNMGDYAITWDDGSPLLWVHGTQVRQPSAVPGSPPITPPAAPPDPRVALAAACAAKGGQIDQEGDCWKGDEKV